MNQQLAIMSVANEMYRREDRRCLALDVARAVSEGRVCWRIERQLRALDLDGSRALFDALADEIGNGASASRVFGWLDQRFPADASSPA